MSARRPAALVGAVLAVGVTLAACGGQGPATTKNYVTPGPPFPSLNTPSNSTQAPLYPSGSPSSSP